MYQQQHHIFAPRKGKEINVWENDEKLRSLCSLCVMFNWLMS